MQNGMFHIEYNLNPMPSLVYLPEIWLDYAREAQELCLPHDCARQDEGWECLVVFDQGRGETNVHGCPKESEGNFVGHMLYQGPVGAQVYCSIILGVTHGGALFLG